MGSLLLDVFTEDPVCVGDGSVDDHLDPLGVILVRVTVVALKVSAQNINTVLLCFLIGITVFNKSVSTCLFSTFTEKHQE